MQTRRQFLRTGAPFAAAVILAPDALASGARAAGKLHGGSFADGVVSGDPATNGIMLWTRVAGVEKTGTVALEVATDSGFRKVVAHKNIKTGSAQNHAVKAKVTGLKPHEQYYYRFATSNHDSPVGRFRTALPLDSNETVRFAFFSCADYTHGYYNAYELMAAEKDLDFVVCLGDYIYDESYHTKADGTAVRDDKIGRPPQAGYTGVALAAHSLQDYRDKYSLYRTDKSLRKMHQKFPMVVLWDDHEVQNNYAGKPDDGGLPANEEFNRARQKAGYRAFFESMPIAPRGADRIYRSQRYGKNVELFVMDQRQYRDNQPCDDAVAPPCADWNQPRDFLGRAQMDWVKSALSASKANWKVMANELMVMPAKVLGGSYYGYDNWQGYPTEREELLQHIKTKAIKDVVFVTGDIHTFIVGDVRTQMGEGENVALEFVGGSITSQGLGETNLDAGSGVIIKGNDQDPSTDPNIINALRGQNPWVDMADFDHHGYGVMEAGTDGMTCDMRRMKTIKQKSTDVIPGDDFKYVVKRGQTSVKGQHGPAAT
ncbi:MAG: alkaline phosphatase [Solirubrobacteraceae bacterium]|jgi:alkaline phosphatase D|nr:alkaline phosphatase [Solirubrobacteraceae bacterium]